MFKKIISIILLLSISVSYVGAFNDVYRSHWAYEYIYKASQNNWINGIDNNKYNPNGKVTVAQWYTMVTRALLGDNISTNTSSNEWYSGKWYAPYIEAAIKNKFDSLLPFNINTVDDAERPITRAEMACIVSSVLSSKNIYPTKDKYNEVYSNIPDIQSLFDYSVGIVNAYSFEIIVGVNDKGTFDGYSNMNRAQAAVVLCRLANILEENGVILPKIEELPQDDIANHIIGHWELYNITDTGYAAQCTASTGIWTGQQGDRTYGFKVSTMNDVENILADIMDLYPRTIVFFSEQELQNYNPDDFLAKYEASHGLVTHAKEKCYNSRIFYPPSRGLYYTVTAAGEYYEYRLDLQYGASGIIRMYQKGIIDELPTTSDIDISESSLNNLSKEERETFLSVSTEEADYQTLLNISDEIKRTYNISNYSSDYEKVFAIYNYITSNIEYDDKMASLSGNELIHYFDGVKYPAEVNFTLINKKTVCFGYALTFQALCLLFDLECYYVDGDVTTSSYGHAWNIVKVDDNYYQVDSTWDIGRDPERYRYFLISDKTMSHDHILNYEFNHNTPLCPNDYR